LGATSGVQSFDPGTPLDFIWRVGGVEPHLSEVTPRRTTWRLNAQRDGGLEVDRLRPGPVLNDSLLQCGELAKALHPVDDATTGACCLDLPIPVPVPLDAVGQHSSPTRPARTPPMWATAAPETIQGTQTEEFPVTRRNPSRTGHWFAQELAQQSGASVQCAHQDCELAIAQPSPRPGAMGSTTSGHSFPFRCDVHRAWLPCIA